MAPLSPILNLCARIEPHPAQRHQLAAACATLATGGDLLQQAEEQGMGPLLHKHLAALTGELPEPFIRALRFLTIRHQQSNRVLVHGLHNILSLLDGEGIPVLVLKGASLCQTLYPEVGLRPMRDIDLLFAKEDVNHAHTFLQENGFRASTDPFPGDHFHLAPLNQTVSGLQICVELHHDLFPNCPPYYQSLPFKELYQTALAFDVHGMIAHTLANEEMLWHLYQHGFHAPLTYEPYRLISVADIVSLVEERTGEIDWQKIQSVYPQLFKALPLFHYITPWNDKVLDKISFKKGVVPSGACKPFKGWPLLHLSEQKGKGLWKILRNTFLPSQWWLMIYYTPVGYLSYFRCKLIRHPIHIFWWMKLYWSIFLKANLPSSRNGIDEKLSKFDLVKNIHILAAAMYDKFR